MTSPSDHQYPNVPPNMFEHVGPPPYQYSQQQQQQPTPNFPSHPMPSTSSAFYPPPQSHLRDPMGESELSNFLFGKLISTIYD